jgi:transcription elongation factor/antiterminator RfaH
MADLEKHWYAVYTKPQREEYAELNLRMRGIESFFPKLFLPKSAQRKRQIVSLFPNYLFVRFQSFEDEYCSVIWCPGVKRLVSFDSIPAPIDDSIVRFLMGQSGPDGVIAARCNVQIGQQVSIQGGPFDGLDAIVQEPPNASGRIKVLLNLLNRPINIDVPAQSIRASWIAAAPAFAG